MFWVGDVPRSFSCSISGGDTAGSPPLELLPPYNLPATRKVPPDRANSASPSQLEGLSSCTGSKRMCLLLTVGRPRERCIALSTICSTAPWPVKSVSPRLDTQCQSVACACAAVIFPPISTISCTRAASESSGGSSRSGCRVTGLPGRPRGVVAATWAGESPEGLELPCTRRHLEGLPGRPRVCSILALRAAARGSRTHAAQRPPGSTAGRLRRRPAADA